MKSSKRRRGFTLIEVLVAIAMGLLALLIGFVVWGFSSQKWEDIDLCDGKIYVNQRGFGMATEFTAPQAATNSPVPGFGLRSSATRSGPPRPWCAGSRRCASSINAAMRRTAVGLRAIDPGIRDAARGMGMTGWQALWRVEVPLAMPLILAGLRSATGQVIATATIAAFVGLGGLGVVGVRAPPDRCGEDRDDDSGSADRPDAGSCHTAILRGTSGDSNNIGP